MSIAIRVTPDQLRTLLKDFTKKDLKSAHAEIRLYRTSAGRVGAVVISDKFDWMDILTRQKRLWSFLKKRMTAAARQGLSNIFTKGVGESVVEDCITDDSQRLPWL